ncbi:MAG: cytidylyltransferase domain-containing protein, partial [Peptostreptococcaceae bacterium]
MKIIAIIQARMGSSRLPKKVMKNLIDKTVLNHVVSRVKMSKKIDKVIVATTTNDEDDVIIEECKKIGVNYFRGSQDDVLSRYFLVSQKEKADIVIRITSDCPLIDPIIIDKMINYFL